MKKIYSLFFAIVLIAGIFSGCKKNSEVTLGYGDKFIGDDKEDEANGGGLLQGPLGASGKKVYEYEGFLVIDNTNVLV